MAGAYVLSAWARFGKLKRCFDDRGNALDAWRKTVEDAAAAHKEGASHIGFVPYAVDVSDAEGAIIARWDAS